MKKGRFYPLGYYSNIKLGFGSIDIMNMKSIYLNLCGWVDLKEETDEIERTLSKIRKDIKKHIYNLDNGDFKKESLVDIDISLKSLSTSGRTYMNTEITLYTNGNVCLKTNKQYISDILHNITDKYFLTQTPFNYFITKN